MRSFGITILLLFLFQGFSQTVLVRKNYLWGLKNLETGFETEAKYLTLQPVNEFGYAQASDDEGQILVHTSGKEYRIPKGSKSKVWSAYCYSYNLEQETVFKRFDDTTFEYHFVNIRTQWLSNESGIPQLYYQVEQLDGLIGLLNEEGELALPPRFDDIIVQDPLVFARHSNGTLVLDRKLDSVRTIPFDRFDPIDNRLSYVFQEDKKGLVNNGFKVIVPPKWKDFYPLKTGSLYVVYNDAERKKLFHVGSQRVVYKKKFTDATAFGDNLIRIENGKKFGLLASTGKVLIPDTLDLILNWNNNAVIGKQKGKFGVIGKKKKPLFPFNHDKILPFGNIALVFRNDSSSVVNINGEVLIPFGTKRIERNKNSLRRKEGDITYIYKLNEAGNLISKREYKNLHVLTINKYESNQDFTDLEGQIKINNQDFEDVVTVNRIIDRERDIYLELRGGGSSHYLYDLKKRKALTGSILRHVNLFPYLKHKYQVVGVGPLKSFPLSRTGFMLRMIRHNGKNIRITNAKRYNFDLSVITTYDKKKGVINRDGKVVITPKYLDLKILNKQFIAIRGPKGWGVMDIQEKTIVPPEFSNVELNKPNNPTAILVKDYANKYGFIDSLGHERSFLEFDRVTHFSEDRMPVKMGTRWTYTDIDGDTSIAAILQRARPFQEGLAAARFKNRWGYLTPEGEWHIEPQFINALEFGDGLAPVKIDKTGYGYINEDGTFILPPKYQRAFAFHNELAIVKYRNKYGLINTLGEWVIKPKYISLKYDKKFKAYIGKKKKYKYQYVDAAGNTPLKGYSNKIKLLGRGYFATKDGYYYKVYRPDGSEVKKGEGYRVIYPFNGTNLVARTRQYWTILDTGFTNVVGEFTGMKDFDAKGEVLATRRRHKYRIQFVDNTPVVASIHTLVNGSGSYLGTFNERELYYLKNFDTEKIGLRDQSNNTMLGCKYDKIGQFENGYASVLIKGRQGLWSITGEEICKPIYERILPLDNGLFMIEGIGKVAYVNEQGEWIVKFEE